MDSRTRDNKPVIDLFNHFYKLFKTKRVLHLNMMENPYPRFHGLEMKEPGGVEFSELLKELDFKQDLYESRLGPAELFNIIESTIDKYDLIITQFPFNVKNSALDSDRYKKLKDFNHNFENVALFETLSLLEKDGFCLFFAPPSILGNQKQKRFLEFLNKEGFFLNGIINAKQIQYYTAIDIYIGIISRHKSEHLYAAELSDFNSQLLVNNFKKLMDKKEIDFSSSTDLYAGVLTSIDEVINLETLKHKLDLVSVMEHYSDFKSYKLDSISKINAVKTGGKHKDKENSIYLPKIGFGEVVYNLSEAKIKHQNLFQIIFDSKIVRNEYAAWFFSSEIGKKLRKSITTGGVIKHINKSHLKDLEIPTPSIEKQQMIGEVNQKISVIAKKLVSITEDVTVNPEKISHTLDQLNVLMEQFGSLSDHDKVKILIKNGEDSKVEFKETFSLNLHTKQKDKKIETASIKTIAAFLNSSGGDLLIGVHDKGEAVGVNNEVKKVHKNSYDKFKLHFKDAIENRVGKKFLTFINFGLIDINGLKVFKINCKSLKGKRTDGCYVDRKDFYVRTDPATTKLEGPDVTKYIRNHFE